MIKKVLLAMSGGIDSSVAAILLKQQNFQLEGITFRSYDSMKESCIAKEKGCCTADSIFGAKHLAETLGFPHSIIDTRKLFKDTVIQNFIDEYLAGNTPNPCVLCNKIIKWGEIFNLLNINDISYLSTGHYARIAYENGRYFLRKAIDTKKDQTYFLWTLSQENLAKTLFPLGELSKTEVREIARQNGFYDIAEKKESQEICFIVNDDYRDFLRQQIPDLDAKIGEGNFINKDGKILGKHKGYPFYTIGQRKGLVIALGQPAFVTNINAATNTITLGKREDIMTKEFWLKDVNFMKYQSIPDDFCATCKVRYKSPDAKATITQIGDKLKVVFEENIFAITPGQSAVIYENDDVVAGGIILGI